MGDRTKPTIKQARAYLKVCDAMQFLSIEEKRSLVAGLYVSLGGREPKFRNPPGVQPLGWRCESCGHREPADYGPGLCRGCGNSGLREVFPRKPLEEYQTEREKELADFRRGKYKRFRKKHPNAL